MLPTKTRAKGSRRRGVPSPAPSSPAPQPESPIVLIADDDETTRLVLQRALTNEGYVAVPVDDGGEIWPILDRENVVALVLDLKMPGVNGWEVLRRLRDDFRYRSRHIRVVVLSGQADAESRDFALQLGAVQFFSKPVDLDALRRAVLPSFS
jgi:two-component system OmpR family response regulator